MDEKTEPKRRGRPALPESEKKKRLNVTLRMRSEIRDRLQHLANESGRSLSEEIEHRLELSFDREATERKLLERQNYELQNSELKNAINEMSKMISDNLQVSLKDTAANMYSTLEQARSMLEYAAEVLGVDISMEKRRGQRNRSKGSPAQRQPALIEAQKPVRSRRQASKKADPGSH